MSNKSKWIKAIGVAATVIGVGVNLVPRLYFMEDRLKCRNRI